MLLNDNHLIEEFEKRDLAMSKRVLTDWRAKGYLSPLSSRGKGQGQGKYYFWSEENVVARALLVDESLQSGFRGARILLILWLFGYEIPIAIIREHLLSGLANLEGLARGEKEGRGAVEEHVEDLVVRYFEIATKYPQLGLSHDVAPAGMEMILNIFANSTYDLNDIPFKEGIAAVLASEKITLRDNVGKSSPKTEAERRYDTEQIWRFVHDHFSLSHMRSAISESSQADFNRAQVDIGTIFRVIGESARGKVELKELREMRVWAAYSFGVLLCAVDLTLRHQGWGSLIDQYLARVETGEFAKS